MSKRNYTHVQVLLPEIQTMVESGKTQREIAEHDGFKGKYVVKALLKRARKKQVQGIPKQRGRKPAKTAEEKSRNLWIPEDASCIERQRNTPQSQNRAACYEKV